MALDRISATTLLALAAAGLPFLLLGRDGAPAEAASGPRGVVAERQYYLLLTGVEVEPEKEPGRRWDSGGSPPDLYYEIWWQGQEVFESATKKNTLVARWTNVAVDLRDVTRGVSLDDSIKAARIAARSGDEVESGSTARTSRGTTSCAASRSPWRPCARATRRGGGPGAA